jgi:hypothetical protein
MDKGELINSINVIVLGSIHKQVKETIHRAFWNVLDAELKEVPPNYTQAMVLLADVKEVIHSTICLWRFDINNFLAYVSFCYSTMVSLFYPCKVCYLCLKCHFFEYFLQFSRNEELFIRDLNQYLSYPQNGNIF